MVSINSLESLLVERSSIRGFAADYYLLIALSTNVILVFISAYAIQLLFSVFRQRSHLGLFHPYVVV
uniref:Uncharacterized protein n=1 Tax=Siphoviridae sp. ctXZx16 TaxID=2826371 RepID=A0A8S5MKH1_9CAUD|nr:MAG TPA: hypothetical protein [Siphoviridae sp. ctXZx16]